MVKVLLVVSIVLFMSTSSVSAQCGVVRRGAICQGTVCQNSHVAHVEAYVAPHIVQEVITPIAVPILIPAFQFQYTPPVAVPVVTNFGGGYAGYGQPVYGGPPNVVNQPGLVQGYEQTQPVTPTIQAQPAVTSQDKIRELAKALLDEMQKQTPVSANDDGPPAVPGQPSIPTNTPGMPPGLPQSSNISPEQASSTAIAALQSKCSACHTGPAAKGEFVMFSQPGVFNQQIPWRSIVREIDSGRMPPKSSQYRISPQEAVAVRAWLSGI